MKSAEAEFGINGRNRVFKISPSKFIADERMQIPNAVH